MRLKTFALAALATTLVPTAAPGQGGGPSISAQPGELLRQFSGGWDESLWLKNFRRLKGYMRPTGDAGWELRMRALQKLVAAGWPAAPTLLRALKTGPAPQRMLAAQALGYLGPDVPTAPLLQAAQADKNAAVRLYAVDALGKVAGKGAKIDWQALLKNERNRDVRMHLNYARERDKPLDPAVARRLVAWDASRIDSAEVGKVAPDFELAAATGEKIRLSDFRGRKRVILVFIYGDT